MVIVTFFLYKDDHHVDAIVLMISALTTILREVRYNKVQERLFFLTLKWEFGDSTCFCSFAETKEHEKRYALILCHNERRRNASCFVETLTDTRSENSCRSLICSHGMGKKKRDRNGRTGYIGASSWRHTDTYTDKWCGIVQP